MSKREYDSTVARIAGNLLSGVGQEWMYTHDNQRLHAVAMAVETARAIVAETKRTEPETVTAQ